MPLALSIFELESLQCIALMLVDGGEVLNKRMLGFCSRIFLSRCDWLRFSITVPKVGILNICSGFRWTAVLESVQRNPLTNAITLQSIPLFWRFFCSEFRCKALDSTIKYLKYSDLAVDSTKHCRGFH